MNDNVRSRLGAFAVIVLGVFLLIFALNTLVGTPIPEWVLGLLAGLAGLLLLVGK